MRWLQLLTAAILPFTALAAKKTGDRFTDARAKSLSVGHPLKLDDGGYASLTRGPRFGCVLCREFQPEWDLLGKSWLKGDKDGQTKLLFGTLDFVDGKNTFQSVWQTHTILPEASHC
jgi:oligosaccharyltransferase complex subunit gamma